MKGCSFHLVHSCMKLWIFQCLSFLFCFQVYIACEEYGLDSIILSGGYFLMAGVFAKQGKMPITRSLYSEVEKTTCAVIVM